jgi:hypothetical protein
VTRALVAVGAGLALCLIVLGAVVYVAREREHVAVDSALAERITREIDGASGSGEEVDLAATARFEWDRVLVFARRTPRQEISARLGSEFRGELPYDVESGAVLVFALGTELARFADYRGTRRFEGLPVELGRDEALLRVEGPSVRAG